MTTTSSTRKLTIGKVARACEVGVETVRFYEREGLMPDPPRSASGYRHYPPAAVERLLFIKRAKALGFTLSEIKDLLSMSDRPDATCGEFKQLAERKQSEIEQRIQDLTRMHEALESLAEACPGHSGKARGRCPILGALVGEGENHA